MQEECNFNFCHQSFLRLDFRWVGDIVGLGVRQGLRKNMAEITMANTRECILKIGVVLALKRSLVKSNLPVPTFLCSYCKRPVRPESEGRTTAAHFEHLKRNLDCPLSDKTTAKRLYAEHKAKKANK